MKPVLAAFTLAAASLAAHADTVSNLSYPNFYTNIGQPVTSTTLTAASTGDVVATFLGAGADGFDTVRLFDRTTNTYFAWMINNHTAAVGQQFTLGSVTAGDALALEIQNSILQDPSGYYLTSGGSPDPVLSSDHTMSTDGYSATYVTALNGGLYVGMEDIPRLPVRNDPGFVYTDSDYNDLTLNVSNVIGSSSAVPEPGSLVLLGSGMLGIVGILRRRRSA